MGIDPGRRIATMDIGTNSVKMLIAEGTATGTWKTIADRFRVTRLGEDLRAHNVILKSALDRTVDAIRSLRGEALSYGVETVAAIGTMCLRTATNGTEAGGIIARETGIPLEILSGEQEAYLAFRAAVFDTEISPDIHTIFDVGGGSTEIISGHGPVVDWLRSIDIGAVDLMERFDLQSAISPDTLSQVESYLARVMPRDPSLPQTGSLTGIGGTITTLAAIHHAVEPYVPDSIHQKPLTTVHVETMIRSLSSLDSEERSGIPGLPPDRADIILAGAYIVRRIFDICDSPECRVNTWGLRHGLLISRFL